MNAIIIDQMVQKYLVNRSSLVFLSYPNIHFSLLLTHNKMAYQRFVLIHQVY